MSEKHMTFVSQCLEGLVNPSKIDDFIDRWHASEGGESIAQFLGFTEEEYACWVEEPWVLRSILFARKSCVPLEESLQWGRAKNVAARSDDLEESRVIEKWLKRTGRI